MKKVTKILIIVIFARIIAIVSILFSLVFFLNLLVSILNSLSWKENVGVFFACLMLFNSLIYFIILTISKSLFYYSIRNLVIAINHKDNQVVVINAIRVCISVLIFVIELLFRMNILNNHISQYITCGLFVLLIIIVFATDSIAHD